MQSRVPSNNIRFYFFRHKETKFLAVHQHRIESFRFWTLKRYSWPTITHPTSLRKSSRSHKLSRYRFKIISNINFLRVLLNLTAFRSSAHEPVDPWDLKNYLKLLVAIMKASSASELRLSKFWTSLCILFTVDYWVQSQINHFYLQLLNLC